VQDQDIPDVAAEEAHHDSAVLSMLLDEGHPMWTVREIHAELGNAIDADDALNRLLASGLIHRYAGFVIASRAAAHAHAIQ
jgi:hypothetical protein